ncbi:mechanosensitive ion channel [Brevundimonas sp. S30B]|uniref:mechanosensitive ion channel family protein n=1 Tax=unclassified Brevundimonas TaxID=2622653 RepID=UPI0010717F28|nr:MULTISPECIES: mechanosensitive ion channel domain-containing protein [unclassified Brevundimonas]QBX38386.1 mechanosensitive ion channel [Brevundimonas sp. MF30-B]TFW02095.1 mechanosensitive ion channel [Brevundimonas sp. S30B]
MQTPPPEAPVPFLEAARRALEGDPVMVREVLGAVGAFSVRLLVAAIILALTLWAAKRLSNFARRALGRLPHRNHPGDTTLSDFLSGLVKWLVIAVGLVAVLQQVGVQTASVLAILGAASLAVGLALQGTLSNVAAGVMILLLRPYRIGDRVEIHGRSGKISDLDLFHTTVVDYDGLTLVYPNGKVFGELIVNVDGSGRRRIDLAFGVDYEDDLDLALRLLLECAAADPRVLKDPEPWSRVTSLDDSAVSVTLRCWTTPADWQNAKCDLIKTVKERFEAEGLSFPFPQRVMMMREVFPSDDAKASLVLSPVSN